MKHDFTKDLLDTVSKILNPVSEQSCEDDMKKPSKRKSKREDDEDEMEEGYVSHAQRKAVWANRADDGKGHPDKKMKKEGYVPTADEPSEKDKQTAAKVRALLAKEKKPVKEAADEPKLPFDGPYRKVGEKRKDQYGNEIKNVAKHLAKKAMNAQKNEEVEELDEISAKTIDRYREQSHRKEYPGPKGSKKYEKRARGSEMAFNKLTGRAKVPARMEEVEQIDEISKATMGRYINKAKDHIDTVSWRQGHKEGSGMNPSGRFEKKLTKRHKGIETAVKKLTKEDAEQIDELSGATLGSYVVKSKKDETARKEHGIKVRDEIRKQTGLNVGTPMDRKLYSPTASRGAGQKMALKKLTGQAKVNANEEIQIDELSKGTLGSYVKKAAGHAAGSAAASAAIASSSNPKVPTKVKRDLRNRMVGISKATDKLTKEEQEFIDALNNDMFEEIENMEEAQNALQKRAAANKKALDTGFMKLSDAEYEKEKKRLAKEEVEIAEANLKVGDYTATSERSKFHDKGYRPHLKNPQGKTSYLAGVAYKSPEHAAGEAAAYHKGYTSGPGKASERGADDAVRAYRHKNKEHMHEDVEITEARGRPRKDAGKDFTIHPKTKEKLMHNNPAHMKRIENLYRIGTLKRPKTEADQNIITQLRKASTSMTGDHKVIFSHGAATAVHGTHAAKILDKHASMKPAEKEAFQKEISHSYEKLKKHF